MANDRHFLNARFGTPGLELFNAPELLLVGKLETFEFLRCAFKRKLNAFAFPLKLLQGRAQILAPRFDRAQERWKGEPADLGVIGALTLARDAILEIRKFAFGIVSHALERCEAAPQIVDAEAA